MSETGRSDDEGCGRDKEERCRSAAAAQTAITWNGATCERADSAPDGVLRLTGSVCP